MNKMLEGEFLDLYYAQTGCYIFAQGYAAGWPFTSDGEAPSSPTVALDFGCKTGGFTRRLHDARFSRIVGVDDSLPNIERAREGKKTLANAMLNRPAEESPKVEYYTEPPQDVMGNCDLVTCVHAHYRHEPQELFKRLASFLKPSGQVILIGHASKYIDEKGDHLTNLIHVSSLSDDVLCRSSDPALIQDDKGYVPLAYLPPMRLPEGEIIKSVLKVKDEFGRNWTMNEYRRFSSDEALINAGQQSGLDLVDYKNLSGQTLILRFKRPGGAFTAPPAP